MEDNIMANTRKSRVPKEEQLKLINECRTSGMTDIDWCREHGIAVSTFYYWVKQLRKEAAQIPAPGQSSYIRDHSRICNDTRYQ